MKTLLLATALLGNAFDYTAEPPFGQPKYDQVMGNFQTGTLPEFSEVIGWWSGNCYHGAYSDRAEGTLLAAVERKWEEKSWWPWADPTIHIERNMAFIVTSGNTDEANHYDNMNETERYQIREFLKSVYFTDVNVVIKDGSITSEDYGRTQFSIRRNGDKFYGIAWETYDTKPYIACSFHKKVD
jgi:hypothetical protein